MVKHRRVSERIYRQKEREDSENEIVDVVARRRREGGMKRAGVSGAGTRFLRRIDRKEKVESKIISNKKSWSLLCSLAVGPLSSPSFHAFSFPPFSLCRLSPSIAS